MKKQTNTRSTNDLMQKSKDILKQLEGYEVWEVNYIIQTAVALIPLNSVIEQRADDHP